MLLCLLSRKTFALYLHSLTKALCSLTKVLQSPRKFVFVHKTSAFSPKNIAFPDKLCICSQNLSVVSQMYCIPGETILFVHKTFAFPRQRFALPKKLCNRSQDLFRTLTKILHSTENFSAFAFAWKLLRTLKTLLLFTKCVFFTKVFFT